MAQKLRPQAETLSGSPQPGFTGYANSPIIAKRAPTSSDTGYPLGQNWVDKTNGVAYELVQVASGSANWLAITSNSGPGSFTTLTSTGATTLATTGASVNTFGNTTGSTSVAISTGTGGFSATAANGAVTINSGTGAVGISTDVTATAISIGTGAADKDIVIGSNTSSSSLLLRAGSGAMNLGTANGPISVTSGTASLDISDDGLATTVQLATGNAAKTLVLGSTNTTSTTTLRAGSGGVNVSNSSLTIATTGNGLRIKGGAVTDMVGTAVLSSGTVTVANTNIATGDLILLSRVAANASTTLGVLSYTISTGASFTINALILGTPGSVQTGDLSSVAYMIVRPV